MISCKVFTGILKNRDGEPISEGIIEAWSARVEGMGPLDRNRAHGDEGIMSWRCSTPRTAIFHARNSERLLKSARSASRALTPLAKRRYENTTIRDRFWGTFEPEPSRENLVLGKPHRGLAVDRLSPGANSQQRPPTQAGSSGPALLSS